jgi:hypothetical protein
VHFKPLRLDLEAGCWVVLATQQLDTGEVGTSWPKIAQVVRSCPTQIPSS